MQISELIDRLEHIKSVAGDIHVVSTEDICGDEYQTHIMHVSIDTCKKGNKVAMIEFSRLK